MSGEKQPFDGMEEPTAMAPTVSGARPISPNNPYKLLTGQC